MRVVAVLTGLMLIGSAEAPAANTPLTMDAQTADRSGGDLFAPNLPDPAAAAPLPASQPDATTSSSAARPVEQITSGNPLWEIPLARLKAWREQPLFAPTRRPPDMVRVAPAPVGPPPKPPEPEKPQLSLLGTVAGSRERIGLFVDSVSKEVLRLKAGENHQGWTLRRVRPRQVELEKGLDNTVLDIAPPDLKPGPPGPQLAGSLPAAPMQAMATSASIGSSVSASSPPAALVNAFKPAGATQTLTSAGVKRALEADQPPGGPLTRPR